MAKKPKIESLKSSIQKLDTRIGSPMATERIRGRELDRIRQRIFARDGDACVDCGRVYDLEIDHQIPLHLGGQEIDSNMVTRCKRCHKIKTDLEEKARSNKFQ